MSLKRGFYLIGLLAVISIYAVWYYVSNDQQEPPAEETQVQACDSCTARHSNITRLRGAGDLTAITDE